MAKYSSNKDIDILVNNLVRKGFTIKRGGKHSFVIFSKIDRVMIPSTPSDNRAFYNFRNQIKKYWGESKYVS